MNLLELLDFFEPPVSIGWNVTPTTALEYLKAKGLKTSFHYNDVSAAEHHAGFTVAKMMDTDMLGDVKASLEDALAKGTPFKEWSDTIIPTLQTKGWWGRQAMQDPMTGNVVVAQLGSPSRLQTIFRTNMMSAYAVGEWEQIQSQAEEAPYLMYDAIDDWRTRPEHAALDGKIHPVNDSFWKHYHPPNGYNCRCSVIQLSDAEMQDLGLAQSPPAHVETYPWTNPRTGKVEQVAKGIDPGFDFNPGQKRLEELQKVAQEKAAALAADAAKAALEGLRSTKAQVAELTQGAVVQAITGAAKLSSASQAAERAAAFALNQAVANKTPYLFKAIEALQKTKGWEGKTAIERLAIAKEKAAKAEQSAALTAYKTAKLEAKKPSTKAQAAFDALPEEAQAAITESVTTQLAETKAQVLAQNTLLDIADGKTTKLQKEILSKLDQAGMKPTEVLAKVQAEAAAAQAKATASAAVSGYKKSLMASKTPSPAQSQAFSALPADKQAKLLTEVADAQLPPPKPAAPPPLTAAKPVQRNTAPTDLDPEALTQTGPQGGSNPGGEFTDTNTGVKWYLKWPDNEEALRNEMLAGKLYAALGVDMPETRLIQFRGKTTIASRIRDGLHVDQATMTAGRVAGLQENFAIDAWLSNWDVIGPDFANTKLNELGRAVRLDPGGALRFRAQGGAKGSAFGNQVGELESLRARTNPAAASVFKFVTEADMEAGTRRILELPEAKIRELVDQFGPLDAKERQALFDTLLARRQDLAQRFPNAAPQAPAPVSTSRVTAAEQKAIEASRANGLTIPTDSDSIEDHHVVISTITDATGKPVTRVALKLRRDAGMKLQKTISAAGGTAPIELYELKARALKMLKSINARATKGQELGAMNLQAWPSLQADIKTAVKELRASDVATVEAARAQEAIKVLEGIEQAIGKSMGGLYTSPAIKTPVFNLDAIADNIKRVSPKATKGSIPWQKKNQLEYNVARIEKGRVIETGRKSEVYRTGSTVEAEVDGAQVKYVAYGKGSTVTSEGYMQIDIPGAGAATTARAFEVLDKLGINSARATEQDRLELYLQKIAAIRKLRNPPLKAKLAHIETVADQKVRTQALYEALSEDAGMDLRSSPNWNPEGSLQAFGHGRTIHYRPDMSAADIAKFEAERVIYHNPSGLGVGGYDTWERVQPLFESGGQLASQMDRVRRGIEAGGSSVQSDHTRGGANYVFTRLLSRQETLKRVKGYAEIPSGVYFKPREALRLDAFSYDGDVFGDVSIATQEERRAKDLVGMIKHSDARNGGGNETNFRDSISLFDSVEKIVLDDVKQYQQALAWFKDQGYATWPDGRKITDVITYSRAHIK